jgi:hypothetical protein
MAVHFPLTKLWQDDRRWWLAEAVVPAVAAMVLLAIWLLFPRQAIFRLDVKTAQLSVTAMPGDQPCWPAALFATRPDDSVEGGGAFRIAEGATAQFTAVDKQIVIAVTGPARADGSKGSAGTWDGCDKTITGTAAPSQIDFIVPVDGEVAAVVQIRGAIVAGGVPDQLATRPALLSEGKVLVTTLAWPMRDGGGSSVTASELALGDVVRLNDAGGKDALAGGFVRISPEDPMRLIATAMATTAHVDRLGMRDAVPVAIAPTLADRLRANAAWLLLVPLWWLLTRVFVALRGLALGLKHS